MNDYLFQDLLDEFVVASETTSGSPSALASVGKRLVNAKLDIDAALEVAEDDLLKIKKKILNPPVPQTQDQLDALIAEQDQLDDEVRGLKYLLDYKTWSAMPLITTKAPQWKGRPR